MQIQQKSGFVRVASCFFLVVLVLMIELPVIFMAGSDNIISNVPSPLYGVFKEEDYASLTSFINDNQYIQIIANKSSSVKQFLSYYANLRQKNEIVFIREYSYHPHKVLLGWSRLVKNFIQDHLEQFKQVNKVKQTWVLVGIEEEIPEKDVVELMKRYPDNKVILVTKKSLKVHCATCTKKKFQEKTFPQLTSQVLVKTVQSQFGLSLDTSTFLVNFYGSNNDFGRLFTALNKTQLLLNQYYQNISLLNQEQKKILSILCYNTEQTEIKWEDINLTKLQKYGAVFINGVLQWRNPNYILNYAIQAQSNCLISQLDKEILQKYDKQQKVINQQETVWQQYLQILNSAHVESNSEIIFEPQNEKKVVNQSELDKKPKKKHRRRSSRRR